MACGVFWGILLICFVQAEHVCCLWAPRALNSQKQNSNTYVGLSQQNSRLRTLGGSSQQNHFRQASVYPASVHSSSLNTQTAVNSGYSQGLSTSRRAQNAPQPAQSSVRLVQSSSVSKPNWQMANSKWNNAQNVPKKAYEYSNAVVSGSSVGKYSKIQNTLADHNKKASLPVQQGAWHSGYLSSSSASVQSPSRQSYSFSKSASHQSVTPKRPTAAYYRQGGSSFAQSKVAAPEPHGQPGRVPTSFTAPARRVPYKPDSSNHYSYPQTGRNGNSLSQVEAKSEGFPVVVRNLHGRYQPSSVSNMVSSHQSYSRSNLPKKNLPVSSQRRNAKIPSGQALRHRPSYNFRELNPSSTNPFQSRWSSSSGNSAQHFHPTRVYDIPQRFGGHPIRRLKDPEEEVAAVAVQKPPTHPPWRPPTYPPQRPATLPPKEMAPYKPKVPNVHPESKWMRFRPPSSLTGAAVKLG